MSEMSLREEIIAIIWGTVDKDSAVVTEKILSKIEKRIDSIINAKVSKHHTDQYSWESRNIDEIVGLLREVKEMLK